MSKQTTKAELAAQLTEKEALLEETLKKLAELEASLPKPRDIARGMRSMSPRVELCLICTKPKSECLGHTRCEFCNAPDGKHGSRCITLKVDNQAVKVAEKIESQCEFCYGPNGKHASKCKATTKCGECDTIGGHVSGCSQYVCSVCGEVGSHKKILNPVFSLKGKILSKIFCSRLVNCPNSK